MYELKLIEDRTFGGKGTIIYEVVNYDGNKEGLQKQIDKLNEEANFWEHYYIKENKDQIRIEKYFDSLD